MVFLVIASEAPYGSDRVYTALRLAAALQARGRVRLFLLCDAVLTATEGQSSADADSNLGSRLRALIAEGAEVKVCGLCVETRGLHHAKLITGVGMGSMAELADWVETSDRVVSF